MALPQLGSISTEPSTPWSSQSSQEINGVTGKLPLLELRCVAPRTPVANEGLVRDSLVKMLQNPGGDEESAS